MPLDSRSPHQPARFAKYLRTYSGWILAVYWLSMFVMTHLPPSHAPNPGGQDKQLHLLGYLGLGLLLSIWLSWRQLWSWSVACRAWLVTVVYAAGDELLQHFVDRQPDVMDAVADVCGSAIGILIVSTTARIRNRSSA